MQGVNVQKVSLLLLTMFNSSACIYANNIDDNICSNSLFRATIPIRKANEKEMLRFQSKLKKNGINLKIKKYYAI